jgi:signal peptide peptidase SppA
MSNDAIADVTRSWLAGHVWALDPGRLEYYAPRALEHWATVLTPNHPQAHDIAATVLQARARQETDATAALRGPVALVPIHGFLSARPSLSALFFGGTAMSDLRATFATLARDPKVREVVLDIDSPGGSVYGVHETFLAIRELAAVKPVTAVVSALAASAGYWLAAAAPRIVCTPSGDAGSIGVYGVHQDRTAYWQAKGVLHTVIAAGAHKTDGLELVALTDESRSRMQRICDAKYTQFIGDVAVGRRTTPDAVRAGYGEGGVLCAEDALTARLVDAIEPIEATHARLSRHAGDAARHAEVAALLAAFTS